MLAPLHLAVPSRQVAMICAVGGLLLGGCVSAFDEPALGVIFDATFDCHGSTYALFNGAALSPRTTEEIRANGVQMGAQLAGCDITGVWENAGEEDFTDLRILVDVREEGKTLEYTTKTQDTRLLIGSSGTVSETLPAGFRGVISLDNKFEQPECVESEGLEYLLCGEKGSYGRVIEISGSFASKQGRAQFEEMYYHYNHLIQLHLSLGHYSKVCAEIEVGNVTLAPQDGKCVEQDDDAHQRVFSVLAPLGVYNGTIHLWSDDEGLNRREPLEFEVTGISHAGSDEAYFAFD